MSRRLRLSYLVALAILKKQWKVITFFAVFLILSAFTLLAFAPFLYGQFTDTSNKLVKPVFTEAVIGQPRTFNPLFSKTEVEKEINSLVFRGLVKNTALGTLEPDLAESFEIVSPTVYQFRLRDNIFWHDGEKFTAADVVYTVQTAQEPAYRSEVESNFSQVAVEAPDSRTVIFRLKDPFSPFLNALTVGIIPEHISLDKYRPVGTGEFRFLDVQDSQVTLEGERNKLKFRFYPSVEAAIAALKLGEVHGLAGQSWQPPLEGWKNFTTTQKPLPYRLVIAFFNTRSELFNEDNKQLRQALAYAVSKEDLITNSNPPRGVIAYNSMPLTNQMQEKTVEKYKFSLKKAEEELKLNGWNLEADGRRHNKDKKLEFSITTISDPAFIDLANKLKSSWEQIGAQVRVVAVSGLDLKDKIVPNRQFDILLTSQLLNSDPDQYVLWHTTQREQANVSGIASPKLDKLLEDGRKTLDEKVRAEKYREFTRLLLDEVPAIFLYYPNYSWIYSKKINGIDLNNFVEPEDRFDGADGWEIKRPLW
jgi:peptide/nickel transport system substrate-binding protein